MAAPMKKYKSNAKIYFLLYLWVHFSFNFESSLCTCTLFQKKTIIKKKNALAFSS